MFEDTIVNEVRNARNEHAAAYDYDAKKILADIQKSQRSYGTRLVRRPPKLLSKIQISKPSVLLHQYEGQPVLK